MHIKRHRSKFGLYRNLRGICNDPGSRTCLHVGRRLGLGQTIEQISAIPVARKFAVGLTVFCPIIGYADTVAHHTDPMASVIFWVTLIFFFSVVGRYLAKRLNQPGVLGELLMGVLMGNLCYFIGMPLAVILREGSAIFLIMRDMLAGVSLTESAHAAIANPHDAQQIIVALQGAQGIEFIKVAYVVDIFSRYGVIFLLFMAGLESSLHEIKRTGRESFFVAWIGVLAPILLGLLVTRFIMPGASFTSNLFVAATLSATSVGITARVLKDMKKLHTREARTIMGAAMMDDILGLLILAIVSSMVTHGIVSVAMVGQLVILAVLFFVGALWLGPWVLDKAVVFFRFLDPWEAKLCVSFLFVMSLAWLATWVQLATIIGAFAAGIIIHEGFFESRDRVHQNHLRIRDLVAPLEALLAPLFFMLIGIQVKLETFLDWHVLLMSGGLMVAAIGGKLMSGLGGSRRDDRLLIGIGMLPRGEVGLVFASIGRTLGVMSDALFSAIILMVIVTTFMAPLWLTRRYAKHDLKLAKKS